MSAERETADRALLRRFEPIIRYTRGEQFLPMDVEPYVRACSLWVQRPDQDPECLAPEGELTLEKLGQPRPDVFGAVHYLKFIEPLNIADLAAYAVREGLQRRDPSQVFRPGPGRLARVGYGSRFVDALFSLTLFTRGRVPGDAAAAAALEYRRLQKGHERHVYYGRVIRRNGWVALQYWFFYPFNNWRSGFFGVNDHEADWEMIYLYLSESPEGAVQPEWIAYASHDFSGDDLRRRWDDPEVRKEGEHPIIFAGAGSHASYFAPGEYLPEVELPFMRPLVRLVDRGQMLWRRLLRQAQGEAEAGQAEPDFNIFRIPFVDYARGDGSALGPGQPLTWDEPALLEPAPDWALHYRGLWGLYARDPVAGENAPAGPVYNRDGMQRQSWYDPLGWAGLNKLPPPDETPGRIRQRLTEIQARRQELDRQIDEKEDELMDIGLEAEAMVGQLHLRQQHADHQARIAALSDEATSLRAEAAAGELLVEALRAHLVRLERGERGQARAHLQRAHHPASAFGLQLSRFAEIWAAISISLMLFSFVGLVLFARQYLVLGLAAVIGMILFVEAGFRRRLPQLITSLTMALAAVAALVLVYEFFWQIVVLSVLVAGGYIVFENLRELNQ